MTDWAPSPRQREREALARRLQIRRGVIASTTTLVLLFVLGFVVTNSQGWPSVRESFFDWGQAKGAFPSIIKGFWLNIRLFMTAEPIILVLAALVAVIRTTSSAGLFPIRLLAIVYTDVFRGAPTVLVVYLVALGVPALNLTGLPNSLYWLGLIGLVLSYVAYVAEVFRAGIDSIHPSQVASARALGLSHGQTLRYVVLPQAVRRVVPPLLNDFVSLQKDTALVGLIGVGESFAAANDYANYHFNFTPFVVVGGLFVLLTLPLARFTDWLVRRAVRREWAGAR